MARSCSLVLPLGLIGFLLASVVQAAVVEHTFNVRVKHVYVHTYMFMHASLISCSSVVSSFSRSISTSLIRLVIFARYAKVCP